MHFAATAAYAASPAKNSTPTSSNNLIDPTRPDFADESKKKKKTKANVSKTKRKARKNPISQLKLQQTLISTKRKLATINGKTMTLGQQIRGAKLLSIDNDFVELFYRGKRYTLDLTFPSAIKEVKR